LHASFLEANVKNTIASRHFKRACIQQANNSPVLCIIGLIPTFMRYVSATCSEYLLNKEVKFSFTATFVFVKQRSYERKKRPF
jgi:hypothetical protein